MKRKTAITLIVFTIILSTVFILFYIYSSKTIPDNQNPVQGEPNNDLPPGIISTPSTTPIENQNPSNTYIPPQPAQKSSITYTNQIQSPIKYSSTGSNFENTEEQAIVPIWNQSAIPPLNPEDPETPIEEEKKYQTGIIAQNFKETMVIAMGASDALLNLMSTNEEFNRNNNISAVGEAIVRQSNKILLDTRITDPDIIQLNTETARVTKDFGQSIVVLGGKSRDPYPVPEILAYQDALVAYITHPAKINKYLRDQKITVKPTDPVYFLQTIVY